MGKTENKKFFTVENGTVVPCAHNDAQILISALNLTEAEETARAFGYLSGDNANPTPMEGRDQQ